MTSDPSNWRLYVATCAELGHSHCEGARAALAGGAQVIQLRDKGASGAELFELACTLRELCQPYDAALVVNDRVDVALAAGAHGVHVGQADLPATETRRLVGADVILGVSATTLAEALTAEAQGADYIGFGPVFDARTTKPDAAEPAGLEGLAEACMRCRVPIIAIGGINPANAAAVMAAGATGIAVISAVVGQDDPETATRALIRIVAPSTTSP